MLSRYKRIGQLTYFDIRNAEHDLIINEGVSNKNKWVEVTAETETIEENKNSKNEKLVLFYKLLYKLCDKIKITDFCIKYQMQYFS